MYFTIDYYAKVAFTVILNKAVISLGTNSSYATLIIEFSPGSNTGRDVSRSLSRQELKNCKDHWKTLHGAGIQLCTRAGRIWWSLGSLSPGGVDCHKGSCRHLPGSSVL